MTAPDLTFRAAVPADLEIIVGMLADDALGSAREQVEGPLPDSYRSAFRAIQADPNNEVLLACRGDAIVGT